MSTLEWLYGDVESRDRAEFSLGDTLDVKTSILLVVIVFLAGLTGQFLSMNTAPRTVIGIQIVCAAAILLSGILAICELWPKEYLLETPDRTKELTEYFKAYPQTETDATVLDNILRSNISTAAERIERNHAINRQKSLKLEWAFYIAVVAMFMETITGLALLAK